MAERASDRWLSIVLSLLLHGVLVAVLVYGWLVFRQSQPPKPTLAIEATVVESRAVPGAARQPPQPPPPAPAPQPPAQPQVEPVGPPEPTPEELARREQALKEQKEQAEHEAQKAAEEKQAEEQRKAEEARLAQERADAERKAREEAEAKKRAEEKVKRQADERDRAERQAELRRNLEEEERATAARTSGALASWESQITARIQRAWLRPPSARQGTECVLYVTQVPGGEVTSVRIGTCNGDQAVRASIEAAVYRASPLPPPPDPSLFERSLVITFKPD